MRGDPGQTRHTFGGRLLLALPLVAGSLASPVLGLLAASPAPERERIPAFARQYRTACSTCHTAAPKLNVLGEAFRLNGYRMPENAVLLRRDDPVPLGAEEWKEEWPRGIWPGELPGTAPVALRIQTDAFLTRDETRVATLDFHFPHEVYFLAGTSLGGSISAFVETEWTREEGIELVQAKLLFQDPIPGFSRRALNLGVGLQNAYLFTFADRQIDRAARQKFTWQEFAPADVELPDGSAAETLVSSNGFRLGDTRASVELSGILGRRFNWGFGVAQGAGPGSDDNNDAKDVYYRVRYKLGGLDLTGSYDPGSGPVPGAGGQLLDRALIVEHFGYFGEEPVADGAADAHRSFGVAARALHGPWDVGAGYVWSSFDEPWGRDLGSMRASGPFAKAELLVLPWVIASLKAESFEAHPRDRPGTAGVAPGTFRRSRILPGAVLLLRQNVRGVLEGDLFVRDEDPLGSGPRPHTLWLRLDVAF